MYAGTTRELIRQHSIEALIQAHDDAKADLAEAGRLIGQAAQRIQAAQIGEDYHNGIAWPHNMTPERLASEDGQKVMAQALKRGAWSYIVSRLRLREMMSIKDRAELDKALAREDSYYRAENDTLPALTLDAVWGWLDGVAANVGKLKEDSIKEVFELLRPRLHEYKTNSEYEIGRKIILQWGGYPSKFDTRPKVCYTRQDEIQAVDNVFHLLDGKGPANKEGGLLQALQTAERERKSPLVAETEYFRVKIFLKGSSHIEIKRLDLLRELNRIGGGARLKHDTAEAKSWRAA